MEEFIQSRQNPRVKSLMKLRDRAERKRLGLFAVEGLRELSRCAELSDVEEIYYCPEFFKGPAHAEFIRKIYYLFQNIYANVIKKNMKIFSTL